MQKLSNDAIEILCEIVEAKKPRLTAIQIAYAFGLMTNRNLPASAIAKDHGITKQAFHQGVKRIENKLGIVHVNPIIDNL